MSEEKSGSERRRPKRHRRRVSHRQNKLLQFLAMYKFQLLMALGLLVLLVAVLVLLISELFAGEELLMQVQNYV